MAVKYVEMTVEEALKLHGLNHKVLVAVQVDGIDAPNKFEKRTYGECDSILRNGEKLFRSLDDFMESVKVYSSSYSLSNQAIEKLIHTILIQ